MLSSLLFAWLKSLRQALLVNSLDSMILITSIRRSRTPILKECIIRFDRCIGMTDFVYNSLLKLIKFPGLKLCGKYFFIQELPKTNENKLLCNLRFATILNQPESSYYINAFLPKAEIPSQRPRLLPRSITRLNSP